MEQIKLILAECVDWVVRYGSLINCVAVVLMAVLLHRINEMLRFIQKIKGNLMEQPVASEGEKHVDAEKENDKPMESVGNHEAYLSEGQAISLTEQEYAALLSEVIDEVFP